MQFPNRYSKPIRVTVDQSGQTSRTRQSEADSCDINKIMERFNRTGQLPVVQTLPPRYGDAVALDFATAQQLITSASQSFMSLPAATRKHFHNDPQVFMESLANAKPEDLQTFKKLGILIERPTTDTQLLKEISSKLDKPAPAKKTTAEKA